MKDGEWDGMSDDEGRTREGKAAAARRRRVARGVASEAAARRSTPKASLQGMLQLPLLEALDEAGGGGRPRDLYDAIARKVGLDPSARDERRTCADGQSYGVVDQQIRWARQTAVAQGLVAGDRGVWELTEAGASRLGRVRRGTVVLIYRTSDGLQFLAHAEDAAEAIAPGSVRLVLTSPPYPVVQRSYGRFEVGEWLAWMSRLVGLWKNLLDDEGTLALNLMDVHVPGHPTYSPYVERLTLDAIDTHGLHLGARLQWFSPTKLANLEWAVKRRVVPRNAMEHVLLLTRSPRPDWDTRRMPADERRPRSPARMASDERRAKERRPGGYVIDPAAFAGTAAPVPSNLIVSGGVGGGGAYAARCRAAGITPHPARFPEALPERVIGLTTRPGDVVYDPMSGSNMTGAVASRMGRRFIASEPMLEFCRASAFRFDGRPDYVAEA